MLFQNLRAYFLYFWPAVGDQEKMGHFSCELCTKSLERWLRGKKKKMRFAPPRIWREPTNHHDDCFFCMVDVSGRKSDKNSAESIHYPDIPSSIALYHMVTGFLFHNLLLRTNPTPRMIALSEIHQKNLHTVMRTLSSNLKRYQSSY